MTDYLIEFRFQGKAKSKLKQLIWDVDKTCSLGTANKKRPVPHITIVTSFKTNNERQLIQDFYDVCSKTELMKFTLKGFDTFEDNRVVFLDIKASKQLNNFRWNLYKLLKSYCDLKQIYYTQVYNFHSTIAMNLSPKKFKEVKRYIKKKHELDFKHLVVRATLLKNGFILKEYDFMQRKMFDRRLSKSKPVLNRTMGLLNKFFKGEYDPDKNIKFDKMSFWSKIKSIFSR